MRLRVLLQLIVRQCRLSFLQTEEEEEEKNSLLIDE